VLTVPPATREKIQLSPLGIHRQTKMKGPRRRSRVVFCGPVGVHGVVSVKGVRSGAAFLLTLNTSNPWWRARGNAHEAGRMVETITTTKAATAHKGPSVQAADRPVAGAFFFLIGRSVGR